jgi:hypothetical protein
VSSQHIVWKHEKEVGRRGDKYARWGGRCSIRRTGDNHLQPVRNIQSVNNYITFVNDCKWKERSDQYCEEGGLTVIYLQKIEDE